MNATNLIIFTATQELTANIQDSEIIEIELEELDATYYYYTLPIDKLKDAIDEAIQLLGSYIDKPHIGDDDWFDNIPDLIDQIGQLIYHAQDNKVDFDIDQDIETYNQIIQTLNESDESGEPLEPFDSDYIETLVRISKTI